MFNIFHKYKKCFGITLLKWNNKQVEFWVCPPNFSVGKHYHELFDGELMLLCGDVYLWKEVSWQNFKKTDKLFKFHHIPKYVNHWFEPKCRFNWLPTIFINIETWIFTNRVSSASIDFRKS